MALSYNLAYQESISVHPTRRQIFAGKPDSTFPNIWQWLISFPSFPSFLFWRAWTDIQTLLFKPWVFTFLMTIQWRKIYPSRKPTCWHLIGRRTNNHFVSLLLSLLNWSVVHFLMKQFMRAIAVLFHRTGLIFKLAVNQFLSHLMLCYQEP